jgi:hypothetical protein
MTAVRRRRLRRILFVRALSRPLPSVPTKVRLLNRLTTLDLGGWDYSSCPKPGRPQYSSGQLRRVVGSHSPNFSVCGICRRVRSSVFCEEVRRVYGLTCNYVLLTPIQIEERIAAVEAGRTAARENAADIMALNELLSRGRVCSLVLLFHSVPTWVAGDWLVEKDGSSNTWYFGRSRFVAGMDSHFDYKAERSKLLAEIQAERQRQIAF